MGNLPFGAGQQFERAANTAYADDGVSYYRERVAFFGRLSPKEGPASHQFVGEVMAYQG